MEGVLLGAIDFDKPTEKAVFTDVFTTINAKLGESAFVKFRGDKPVGGLAPAFLKQLHLEAWLLFPN